MTVLAERMTAPAGTGQGRLVAGRYRLRALLGRGGMGRVWLAQDELLQREVAVKQAVGPASDDVLRAGALSEIRAAARVDHTGVVRVHDLVTDDGPWIVMERLSGRTLAEALTAHGALPVAEVARIAALLLDALAAVHEAGLAHGDVKPANVHLCDDGRVVLTDFGIARALDDETTIPGGGLAGSPAYMSPERARGDVAGPEADLFSLGATLFAAAEGASPFGKGDPFTTLVAVVEDSPGPFDRSGPLRPVIEGLLAKKPRDRWTIEQARAALPAEAARAVPA
jgi:serine/threonine protein kinase